MVQVESPLTDRVISAATTSDARATGPVLPSEGVSLGDSRSGSTLLTTPSSSSNKQSNIVRRLMKLWLLVAIMHNCITTVAPAANQRKWRGRKIKKGTISSTNSVNTTPDWSTHSGN